METMRFSVPHGGGPAGLTARFHAEDVGRLETTADGHGADRGPALGAHDVAQHVHHPLDFESPATPIPVPRILIADRPATLGVGLDKQAGDLGRRFAATFLETLDSPFMLQRIARLRSIRRTKESAKL